MNRYFADTLYYLKRAVKTAKRGVTEEVEPVERKVRSMTGREQEKEPTRREKVVARADRVREQVARRAQRAVDRVRPRGA